MRRVFDESLSVSVDYMLWTAWLDHVIDSLTVGVAVVSGPTEQTTQNRFKYK